MADARNHSAGHYMLSLDGEPSIVRKFDGGNISAEVVVHNMGPTNVQMKHISTLKFEPFTLEIGMSMGKSLYEWIQASFDMAHIRKNGYMAAADFNYKAKSYRHFRDALITEVGFPALSGASKDPAYFTVKFDPEEITYAPGDDAALKGVVNTKQKKWLASNFRVKIGDLPCASVSEVAAFSWKQGTVEDAVGEFRVNAKEPSKVEVPNINLTIGAKDLKPWSDWFTEFVIKGNNGQEAELSGTIEYLSPNTGEVLGAVELFNVGIFKLTEQTTESNKDAIKRFTVDLYCETMKLRLDYV
ncbi:MAG: hypothetical protein H6709_20790 [Kofleriaceae bacterium]|nr:hypothetical protein [Myxococcales bacterium]MCB9561015.1 hypothetical protein [Kofleriaceae bacterium]MCB9574521.1 hypothetical protein [Kofleriaceae bacterium]